MTAGHGRWSGPRCRPPAPPCSRGPAGAPTSAPRTAPHQTQPAVPAQTVAWCPTEVDDKQHRMIVQRSVNLCMLWRVAIGVPEDWTVRLADDRAALDRGGYSERVADILRERITEG